VPTTPLDRAKVRLTTALASEPRISFSTFDLADAVVVAYELGEIEVVEQVLGLVSTYSDLHRSTGPLFHDPTGRVLEVHTGKQPLDPSTFGCSLVPYNLTRSEAMEARHRHLTFAGRYVTVKGNGPRSYSGLIESLVEALAQLLETLQAWIETNLFTAVEEFGSRFADRLYSVLVDSGIPIADNRWFDVAIIGKHRGWRIPTTRLLDRALRGTSSADTRDATKLAATFVDTVLPRDQLLMAKALDSHEATVFPFRKAKYHASGSLFGVACRLIDGDHTSLIHPVFESPSLGVVVIYPAGDATLKAELEEALPDIERSLTTNFSSFEAALSFIESGMPSSQLEPTPNRSLVELLEEATRPLLEPPSPPKPDGRIRRRLKARGKGGAEE
jgi:hypothetical protein